MTLILWKAPVVHDFDEAERLLQPYYDHGDESAFQSSADVTTVANELLRRFPDADDGPWADSAPEPSDRVLLLSIRWGASNTFIDAIVDLAREHQLVVYDPQGPDVGIPDDPAASGPIPPIRLIDHVKILLMGAAAAGVFWLGWWIDVPVLDWVLMIVGGFLFSVVLFLIGILIFGPRDDEAERTSVKSIQGKPDTRPDHDERNS